MWYKIVAWEPLGRFRTPLRRLPKNRTFFKMIFLGFWLPRGLPKIPKIQQNLPPTASSELFSFEMCFFLGFLPILDPPVTRKYSKTLVGSSDFWLSRFFIQALSGTGFGGFLPPFWRPFRDHFSTFCASGRPWKNMYFSNLFFLDFGSFLAPARATNFQKFPLQEWPDLVHQTPFFTDPKNHRFWEDFWSLFGGLFSGFFVYYLYSLHSTKTYWKC